MITVVYLSNNIVRVVVGDWTNDKVVIEKEVLMEIPEGSLINGVITDSQELSRQLNRFWEQHDLPRKNVQIVVHSSKFVVKWFRLSKMGKRKTAAMIPLEFAAVDRYEDPVYDYMNIPGGEQKATREVMGIMAERQFVEEYIQLFNKLGIEVDGFTNSLAAVVKALDSLPQLETETCIVQIVDGHNLESILWIDGTFAQSTNQRIIADPLTQDFTDEILRHASTMHQFYQSLKLEQKLADAYICGISRKEIGRLQELELEYATGLEFSPLETNHSGSADGEMVSDYIYAYGMLTQRDKDINLLPMLKKRPDQETQMKNRVKALAPVLALLVVSILVTAILSGSYLLKKNKLADLNVYLGDFENASIADHADILQDQILSSQSILDDTAQMERMLTSYPLLNQQVAEAIAACSNEEVTSQLTSYQAEDGALVLTVIAKRETAISQYAAVLYDTGLFVDIEYSGYTYQEAVDEYGLEVTCYLAPEAGRQTSK